MKLSGVPLVCALALSGCVTPPTYYHPNKTQAEFDRDKYDCEQDATEKAANMGVAGNPFILPDYHRQCMTQKHGYTIGPPAAQSQPPPEPTTQPAHTPKQEPTASDL